MGATVYAFNEVVTLDTHQCGQCGLTFAIPRSFIDARKRDRKTFWCPNGHPRAFLGETLEGQLRRELEATRARAVRAEELRCAALKERDHEAVERKKVNTRLRHLKERVGNGVCPCCKRSFVQLARHMATQHPDYRKRHDP